MSQQAAALIQIGQLLTKSGLLTHESLAEALIRAKERGLPIGTVLLTMGIIRQRELRAAVEAQSLVNDGLLTAEMAVDALIKAKREGTPFDDALKSLGWHSKSAPVTNKLGELLVDGGLLSEEQLGEALATSLETGMPLGRVLTFKRMLSDAHLLATLSAQRMIREGTVTRQMAVNGLKAVKQRKISLEESLAEGGFLKVRGKRSTPVGYLLVEAGFISEVSLMMCVELSLGAGKPVVEILVEQGFASRELAVGCGEVQQLIDAGTMTKELAVSALQVIQKKGCSVARAVAEVGMPPLTQRNRELLEELFVLSGIVEPRDMPKIADSEFDGFDSLAKTLMDSGKIAEHMIDALIRSLYLIDEKLLLPEDAVMALHYCRKNIASLDQALPIMGWKAPTGRKI